MGILKKQKSMRAVEMRPEVGLENGQGFQIGVNSKTC